MVVTARYPRKSWNQLAPVRASIFHRDEFTCLHCGWTPEWIPVSYDGTQRLPAVYFPKCLYLTLDHIMPLLHGGTNDIDNFQTLCTICNSRKGHRVPA